MLIGLGIGIPFIKQNRLETSPTPEHPGDNLLLESGDLLLLENNIDAFLLEV